MSCSWDRKSQPVRVLLAGTQRGELGVGLQAVQAQVVDAPEQGALVGAVGPAGGCDHFLDQADGAQLLEQAGVEGHFVGAVQDVAGAGGQVFAPRGVDLDQQQVVRRGVADQGQQAGVARVAAVPVGLAVDLHGLEQQGQAGRGQHHVGGELGLPEDAQLAGADLGGGDEQVGAVAVAHALEIHGVFQDGAQGVEVERVELVGRELGAHDLAELLQGRGPGLQPGVVGAQQAGPGPGGELVKGRALGHTLPETAQVGPGAFAATLHQAGGQGHGVHGAGAGAADAGDLQRFVFQQAIEHAPGEGAVRSTALQGEVELLFALWTAEGALRRAAGVRGMGGGGMWGGLVGC